MVSEKQFSEAAERYLDTLYRSAAEVGELLGLNVSTVQTRLARARAKLKSLLEE